nr:potassium-transporting ATPase subunit KdpC [uncultured Duganella sp.]
MLKFLRPAVVIFSILTLICGVIYPFVTTLIGMAAFSNQVTGSLVEYKGKIIGSSLIGQSFTSSKYFWGRPSATSPMPNNASGSTGSMQAPTNPALIDAVKGRIAALRAVDRENNMPIPVDLVTASASGLDPEISIAAIEYQLNRVARNRHIAPAALKEIVTKLQNHQWLGFFGEPSVNVLALNLALDQKYPAQ